MCARGGRSMKQPEHQHQTALFRWAGYQTRRRPELSLMFAIPNGGRRDAVTGARLKAEGVKPGVPDIFLPVARQEWHGLFIELKAGRNKLTQAQTAWHAHLSQQGYRVAVCYGYEAAIEVIEEYLA